MTTTAPAIGQVWRNTTPHLMNPTQENYVRITSIGETVSGTQIRVSSWFENVRRPEEAGPFDGVMHLDRLLDEFEYVRTEETA